MNSEKRVTIKDVARESGYSIATIHCALNGKPGVGDAARQQILDTAKRMEYEPNKVAASLNRKTYRVIAAFPEPVNGNQYYYNSVWKGVRECMDAMRDFKIELQELPYDEESTEELTGLIDSYEADGLLTSGYMDLKKRISVKHFTDKGIPVALIGDDRPDTGRLCCVQPNYEVIGRTLAELLMPRVGEDQAFLIMAGDSMWPSHYQIVEGFENYLREKGSVRHIYKIQNRENETEERYERLLRFLKNEKDIGGCFSVYARGSVLLGQALEESGRAGTLAAVGSDLFQENMDFLKRGVFTNLSIKNPYAQTYLAAKVLVEYLLKGTRPASDLINVGSEIVFQSSIPIFEKSWDSAINLFM